MFLTSSSQPLVTHIWGDPDKFPHTRRIWSIAYWCWEFLEPCFFASMTVHCVPFWWSIPTTMYCPPTILNPCILAQTETSVLWCWLLTLDVINVSWCQGVNGFFLRHHCANNALLRCSRDMLEPFCWHSHSYSCADICFSCECVNMMVELSAVYHWKYLFVLFCCCMVIRIINPLGGLSFSSRYGTNQPLSIHV